MSLLAESRTYKPFTYPWAFKFWERQMKTQWLADEVPMTSDVRDFKSLSPKMRSLIIAIFRMFVQADVDVASCYHKIYQQIFKPTEIQMMLSAFSVTETVHIQAYSHLLDTLGLPPEEYAAFLEIEEMRAKHDWMRSFNPTDPQSVAETLAAVSGFGEGLMLFASFAMLLNFPRQNLLKGMGQIVSWSVRDESLHCEGIMKLYHTWVREKSDEIDEYRLGKRISVICDEAVAHEDAFIDLAFAAGDVPGLKKSEIKSYVRYIANHRLQGLGQPIKYSDHLRHPIPWVDGLQAAPEHVNFFENQGTEYSRASSVGDWGDVQF